MEGREKEGEGGERDSKKAERDAAPAPAPVERVLRPLWGPCSLPPEMDSGKGL